MLNVPFHEFLNIFESVDKNQQTTNNNNHNNNNNNNNDSKRKRSNDVEPSKKHHYYLAQNPIWHEDESQICLSPLKNHFPTPKILTKDLKNINLWMCCESTTVKIFIF